jgi:hypothetical protein
MKELRGKSQILFGFLPEQTVDLRGQVWKVREWQNPIRETVDVDVLRREIRRAAAPWAATNRDGGLVQSLYQGHDVRVHSLNTDNGVKVTSFPDVWMCKACRRIRSSPAKRCACGSPNFGQLPFVGYHDACGALRAPFIPKCKTHRDVRVVLPGTASAAEIRFECPICGLLLRKGFGFPACQCGDGRLTFNVHRAASVYTPRTVVIVNPPSPEHSRRLAGAGGARRALAWVIRGMKEQRPDQGQLTRDGLKRQLVEQGLGEDVAEAMVQRAVEFGQLASGDVDLDLDADAVTAAEEQAVTLAMAVMDSRRRVADLQDGIEPISDLGVTYHRRYPKAMAEAGLESVELIDRFPVLTGNFGYTRGSSDPGATRLVPFRDRAGNYIVYGDLAETEALLFRLSPTRIVNWLRARGFTIESDPDESRARVNILRAVKLPSPGDQASGNALGRELVTLVHSFAHRVIRTAAVFAGIERHSLSELLLPLHGAFFVYAAARGDFVLGGLQAVFEADLDKLLREVTRGDTRCALDPGCSHGGGACMACLHIGEPSCRYFNRWLGRPFLSGSTGYLRPAPS